MPTGRCVVLVSLGAIACSADRPTSPSAVPVQPHPFAELNLSLTGATPLYSSSATGINDSGVVVGFAQVTAAVKRKAAVWTPPDYHVTILADLGPAGTSMANAIGNDGTIGGEVCDGDVFGVPCHPAYWRNGILHELAGLGEVRDVCPCDGHTLVGRTIADGKDHGAIWVDDVLIDVGIPDQLHTAARLQAVSHGYIVGNEYDGTEETYESQHRPFRWSPTTGWTSLGPSEQYVYDVNSHGSAVGGLSLLWPDGGSTAVGISTLGLVRSINDSETIAGYCAPGLLSGDTSYFPCEWTAEAEWVQIGAENGSAAVAINNSNEAVGSIAYQGRSAAALWRP